MDPLAGSSWSAPGTVAGFAQSAPNPVLMRTAADLLTRHPPGVALDIGCGAARNTLPLAQLGWEVVGIDLSRPMLVAAASRLAAAGLERRPLLVLAPMQHLPIGNRTVDLVVAHGIWNLAPSGAVFRAALREAARVARPGACLFVFTFSRHTLPAEVPPVAGESFVFTQFSGQPQCFLTEPELIAELAAAGFAPDGPLTEYNRPTAGTLAHGPVIFEGVFRRLA